MPYRRRYLLKPLAEAADRNLSTSFSWAFAAVPLRSLGISYERWIINKPSSFFGACPLRPCRAYLRRGLRGSALIMSASSTPAAGSFSVPEESSPSKRSVQPQSAQPEAIQEVDEESKTYQEVKSIEPQKISQEFVDASGKLQVDDGSQTGVSLMPSPLYRRGFRRKRLDLSSTLQQLRQGFDTGIGATLWLTFLFASWYWSNTAFNVYNKQILKVFPFPVTCTVVQFFVASIIMASLWLFRLKQAPAFTKTLIGASFPVALFHGAGFLLTNMSLGKVSVAFTHTVKSTEPFFSAALTPSILGEVPTWGIVGSLFPIVTGVALASATDVSFNWPGFISAIGSNVALQSRNVLSKKLISQNGSPEQDKALEHLDNINLFAMITILAFFLLGPICALTEGFRLTGRYFAPSVTGMPTVRLLWMLVLGGVCRCLDVLSSYMILQRVSPVTHSVGNCVKRAVVIVVSIMFFKTALRPLNIVGTCLALVGVFIYSIIVSACKQNRFGPDSPFCKPIYELELTEGGGI